MFESISRKLSAANLKLDPRMMLLLMAFSAAIIAVMVVFYLWRDNESFRPLYGSNEAYPAADVLRVLDSESVRYRLHPQSGQILVPEDQLSKVRMLLTAKGVQAAVPVGYELFDKDEPLGTSQFVQNVRLQRSLEGELARTIMTLKGVDRARVHLVLQESSSFVISKRDPARASVMLQVSPGYKLASEQVAAIVDLVANSVPQLTKDNISVVDQHGVLLSRGLLPGNGSAQDWHVVEGYQSKAVANIEQVLAPIFGRDNFRISVSADMDLSQREETVQTFGEAPRVRREALRDESVLDKLALGIPGSLSNRPVPAPKDDKNGKDQTTESKGETSLRKEANRQLDYDQSITHVKHAPFRLRRQSVAVVLNSATAPDGGWSPEARAELEAMVKSAVGFDASRGDLLTLTIFPFAEVSLPPETPVPWWQDESVHELVKIGLLSAFSLLLLLMVVRPAIRSLARAVHPPAAHEHAPAMQALPNEFAEKSLLRHEPERQMPNIFGELNPLSEIRLPAPGSGLEMQMEHLEMLAKNEPERVSEVIKQWIGRNELLNNT